MRWRGPLADDLAFRVKTKTRRRYSLPLAGLYSVLCKFGLHFLHHSLARDMWVCSCNRNFIYAEEIR